MERNFYPRSLITTRSDRKWSSQGWRS